MKKIVFSAFALIPSLIFALDDVPVFYDGDCEKGLFVPKWSVVSSGASLVTVDYVDVWSQGKTLPISCTEKYRGSSSVSMKISSDLSSAGYYQVIMKFADDKMKLLASYSDIRFRVKNKGTKTAKLRPLVQIKTGYANKYGTPQTIAIGADWTEVVIPFSAYPGFAKATDSVVGLGFGYDWNAGDTNPVGSAMDLLLDDVRITDGTDHAPLDFPTVGGGAIPANWPSHFLLGTLDNDGATTLARQAGEYRYNYVMPTIMNATGSWSLDTYSRDYMMKSDEFGIKSAFVYYNFGKDAEALVASNLASSSYMTTYVANYEKFLAKTKDALNEFPSQSPVIIVLEPDTYGKLMQDKLKSMNAAEVPVNMAQANVASGKTYTANLQGWAEYMVQRAKTVLGPTNVVVGHMLNHWGVNIPGQIGQGRVEAHIMGGYAQGDFLNSFGANGKGDVVFVEKADRDAGIKLTEQPKEDWFWVDTNYTKYFGWVKCLSVRSNLRVVGWQVSEGSSHQTQAKFKDDALEYFLAHKSYWADAGFIGILFGGGLPGNANYPSDGPDGDGGWLVSQVNAYTLSPLSLQAVLTVSLFNQERSIPGFEGLKIFRSGSKVVWQGLGSGRMELRDLNGRIYSTGAGDAGAMDLSRPGLWVWRAVHGVRTVSGAILW
jgi:hypothetical protein